VQAGAAWAVEGQGRGQAGWAAGRGVEQAGLPRWWQDGGGAGTVPWVDRVCQKSGAGWRSSASNASSAWAGSCKEDLKEAEERVPQIAGQAGQVGLAWGWGWGKPMGVRQGQGGKQGPNKSRMERQQGRQWLQGVLQGVLHT
jgi:hypothetical protein